VEDYVHKMSTYIDLQPNIYNRYDIKDLPLELEYMWLLWRAMVDAENLLLC